MDHQELSVLIIDGESDLSLSVARCLGQIPGISIHALSREKYPSLRFSKYLSSFHFIQPNNPEERIELITKTAKITDASVILPVAGAMRFSSKHSEQLSNIAPIAPIPPLNLFDLVVDKWSLTQFMHENNIPIPETVLLESGMDLEQRIRGLNSPLILKLTRGSAGQDIFAFDVADDFFDFLERKRRSKARYLVQGFVEGYDIRCGILCKKGVVQACTIHKGVLERSRKFGPPAGIQFIESKIVFEIVEDLVSKLNWTGIASIDLRYDVEEDSYKVLEINPRYWGSLLGALCAGVNFPYLACLSGLNIPFNQPEYEEIVYLTGKATIQQSYKKLISHSDLQFSLSNTSWKYGLTDPFADLSRVGRAILSRTS